MRANVSFDIDDNSVADLDDAYAVAAMMLNTTRGAVEDWKTHYNLTITEN